MSEVNRNCYYWVGTINEENMDPYSVSIDADNGMVTLKKTMQTYPLPSTTFGSWIIFSNTYMPVRCVKDYRYLISPFRCVQCGGEHWRLVIGL